jgi:hypothetical protein
MAKGVLAGEASQNPSPKKLINIVIASRPKVGEAIFNSNYHYVRKICHWQCKNGFGKQPAKSGMVKSENGLNYFFILIGMKCG